MKKIIIFISFFSTMAFADKSTGCGVGWYVTDSMTTTAATSRNTTNMSFSSYIAMTFGTSGCKKHSFVKKEMVREHYVINNFDFIIQDIALGGEGEYLQGLIQLSNCSEDQSVSLKKHLQSNLEQYINRQSQNEYLNVLNDTVSHCSLLST